MREALMMSLLCLAVVAGWMTGAGVMKLDARDEPPRQAFVQDGDRILLVKCKFTGDAPRVWLVVEAHNGHEFKERGFDPSLTRVLSDYKPVFRKLPSGQWEIGFESEVAEGLP